MPSLRAPGRAQDETRMELVVRCGTECGLEGGCLDQTGIELLHLLLFRMLYLLDVSVIFTLV